MPSPTAERSKRALEPIDRISEVLFGMIMVLTFTGSLSVAESGRAEVRTMLIGALGCNLAWGIIDAVFYLMGCVAERGSGIRTLMAVRKSAVPEEAHRTIAGALPPILAATLRPEDFESMRQKLNLLPEPSLRQHLTKDDFRGALAVFLFVFLATFPVAIPFLFMQDASRALRASNSIAIAMLFLTGFSFGRLAGIRPWSTGLAMVVVGAALAGLAIVLGG